MQRTDPRPRAIYRSQRCDEIRERYRALPHHTRYTRVIRAPRALVTEYSDWACDPASPVYVHESRVPVLSPPEHLGCARASRLAEGSELCSSGTWPSSGLGSVAQERPGKPEETPINPNQVHKSTWTKIHTPTTTPTRRPGGRKHALGQRALPLPSPRAAKAKSLGNRAENGSNSAGPNHSSRAIATYSPRHSSSAAAVTSQLPLPACS